MKKNNVHKKITIIVFFIIITVPMLIQAASDVTKRKLDFDLKGYYTDYDKPHFSFKDWLDGKYKTDFTNWADNEFATRGFFIKNYNQFRYALHFPLYNSGKQIVGKNRDVMADSFIASEICLVDDFNFAVDSSRENLETYVKELTEVNEKLEKNGKKLFFFITPSKGHYDVENIPEKYYIIAGPGEKVTGHDYLCELLSETDLLYSDTNEFSTLVPEGIPIFYTTGVHWSRPYEQLADEQLLKILEENAGENYKDIELKELQSSKEPYWRDYDVQDLLNLYTVPDITYYEYAYSPVNEGRTKPLRALIQGGSFSKGLLTDYFEKALDSSCYHIFYMDCVTDVNTSEIKVLSDWSDTDLQNYLDDSDWVIIELNEGAIPYVSNGFVTYLNNFLDTYVPSDLSDVLDEKYNPLEGTGLKRARGYYGFEKDFSWATPDSCLNLYNERIKDKGLQIDFELYPEVIAKGEANVKVFVNGKLCAANTYSEVGDYTIEIPADILEYDYGNVNDETGTADENGNSANDEFIKNRYAIEIVCDKYFVPSEISDSKDNRKLSLRMKYAGEKK